MSKVHRTSLISIFWLTISLLTVASFGQDLGLQDHKVFHMKDLAYEMDVQMAWEEDILSRPGVLGIGIGVQDDRPALVVVVDQRKSMPLIPKQLGGIPVVVRKGTPPEPTNGGTGCYPCHLIDNVWPPRMGTSVGNATSNCNPGTMGFKACRTTGKVIGFVTNNHIAASQAGRCPNGSPPLDQRHPSCSVYYQDYVGTLTSSSHLIPIIPAAQGYNTVDAAFVTSPDANTRWQIWNIGYPSTTAGTAVLNSCVKKSGRTSGLTYGKVQMVNYTTPAFYYGASCIAAKFKKVIVVEANTSCGTCTDTPCGDFSTSGDSGSALVNSSNQIVGLLFAKSGTLTYANPISEVLTKLGLSLNPNACN